jgi:hypothetical protein
LLALLTGAADAAAGALPAAAPELAAGLELVQPARAMPATATTAEVLRRVVGAFMVMPFWFE